MLFLLEFEEKSYFSFITIEFQLRRTCRRSETLRLYETHHNQTNRWKKRMLCSIHIKIYTSKLVVFHYRIKSFVFSRYISYHFQYFFFISFRRLASHSSFLLQRVQRSFYFRFFCIFSFRSAASMFAYTLVRYSQNVWQGRKWSSRCW